ncbi:hypothetical protein E2C01_025964 [Portunus trituberculatus]|uniref:Uncharacterized protein n=1 Tax=Portunus trituberculatus TaxID=210409 RepID=A0A5B7EEU6_PORTR|nr:hypothetical protein [Portunus trituberculatus]
MVSLQVFPVLEVFQEALHLMCESLVPTPPHCQEQHSLHPPVSLHHCFTFFTSAAMCLATHTHVLSSTGNLPLPLLFHLTTSIASECADTRNQVKAT